MLYGTSGTKDLCMDGALSQLPYLRDLDKREKKVLGMLKSHQLAVAMQLRKGGLFSIGKAGSHCVLLLYCEDFLQVLLGIYCKRF